MQISNQVTKRFYVFFQATPYAPQQPAVAGQAPYSAYQPAAGVAGMVPLNQRGNYEQYHAYLDKLQQDRNSRERGSPVTPFDKLLVVEVVVLVLFATSVFRG